MQLTLYTDHDRKICAWLRQLIHLDAIRTGTVLERDIADITPYDVKPYHHVHFFAGIGGWEVARELAGWEGPLWSASLPCQPFSCAGKQLGDRDERHLWPVFRELVSQCKPPVLVGEQVASKLGREWFTSLQANMEEMGYWCTAVDLGAASIGAPHIRQRLYWCAVRLADSSSERRQQVSRSTSSDETTHGATRWHRSEPNGYYVPSSHGEDHLAKHCRNGSCCRNPNECDGNACWLKRQGFEYPPGQEPESEEDWLVQPNSSRSQQRNQTTPTVGYRNTVEPAGRPSIRMADSKCNGQHRIRNTREARRHEPTDMRQWDNVIWLPCADGKARPIKPGIEPLVNGISGGLVQSGDTCNTSSLARATRLKGYGNSIVPQVAAVFLKSLKEALYNP